MDVRAGYNNIRFREGDEEKATFKTNMGLFKPTVMPFDYAMRWQSSNE